MEMGDKIYNLRVQKGLTLEQLGNLVGVGKSTVRKWENGMIANMRRDKILKVSEALGTTPSYLMGWDEKMNGQADRAAETPEQPAKKIEQANCTTKEENITGCDAAIAGINADFCLTVADDSMVNARILEGDIVFIKRQDKINNGEIAALTIDGCAQSVLKRFYHYKERSVLILKSDNPAYEDMFFQNEELEKVKILGKAIAFQSMIR